MNVFQKVEKSLIIFCSLFGFPLVFFFSSVFTPKNLWTLCRYLIASSSLSLSLYFVRRSCMVRKKKNDESRSILHFTESFCVPCSISTESLDKFLRTRSYQFSSSGVFFLFFFFFLIMCYVWGSSVRDFVSKSRDEN